MNYCTLNSFKLCNYLLYTLYKKKVYYKDKDKEKEVRTMTIQYIGKRACNRWGGKEHRIAEFIYEDKEEEKFMKIVEFLKELGYEIDTGVENWAAVEVNDRSEFEQLIRDYKKAKGAV